MRDVQAPNGRFTDVAPVGGGFGGVLWGSAGIVVPWEVYLQYKDTALLERHYPAMVAYVDYLETTLDPKTGLSTGRPARRLAGPAEQRSWGRRSSPRRITRTTWASWRRSATLLGKTEDAAKFQALYDTRKAFFNATFVNAERKTLATGRAGSALDRRLRARSRQFRLADTQTSYAVGLGMGLFSPEHVPFAVKNLADAVARENADDDGVTRPPYSLMTGFIGTSWVSKALSQHGQSRAGVPVAAESHLSVLALRRRPGRDDDLGAAQRLHDREGLRRQQQHELVQPLLLRRRRASG